jgi:hypothetical protein
MAGNNGVQTCFLQDGFGSTTGVRLAAVHSAEHVIPK